MNVSAAKTVAAAKTYLPESYFLNPALKNAHTAIMRRFSKTDPQLDGINSYNAARWYNVALEMLEKEYTSRQRTHDRTFEPHDRTIEAAITQDFARVELAITKLGQLAAGTEDVWRNNSKEAQGLLVKLHQDVEAAIGREKYFLDHNCMVKGDFVESALRRLSESVEKELIWSVNSPSALLKISGAPENLKNELLIGIYRECDAEINEVISDARSKKAEAIEEFCKRVGGPDDLIKAFKTIMLWEDGGVDAIREAARKLVDSGFNDPDEKTAAIYNVYAMQSLKGFAKNIFMSAGEKALRARVNK
ncbi:MAG: hypothetical protein Q7T16_05905 [Candidatus Burarchaeum sp.]|nr:hypothetical protein [Candidatus Burarchaeum sp.]MDO8340161.1 hypothetical protein [Candidatus Burarchaeum sp.]